MSNCDSCASKGTCNSEGSCSKETFKYGNAKIL